MNRFFFLFLVLAGATRAAPPPSPRPLPEWPQPVVEYFVSPDGNDASAGTSTAPFATIEKALDSFRQRHDAGGANFPATIWLASGTYPLKQTLRLEMEDSGQEGKPVSIRAQAGAVPVLSGFVPLRKWIRASDDAAVSARLAEAARAPVIGLEIPAEVKLPPLELGGFGSGRGFRTRPLVELYCDGKPMPMASGPEGGLAVREVGPEEMTDINGLKGSKAPHFLYEGEAPARWAGDPNAWLHGYWFWDWAESYEKLAAVDPAKHEIRLTPPIHQYGFRVGQKFRAVHALAELDRPGEWYLDPISRRLWFWPPENPAQARLELAAAAFPLVEARNVSHFRIEGLTWEGGADDGLRWENPTNCLMVRCTVRRLAGDGVTISGGSNTGLSGCDLHTLGRGGVVVRGGDRKTLAAGGHFVENCHIHDLSRIDRTYTPGILCDGTGQRLACNLIDHVPSSAIRLGGNDHVVEGNEICHVVTESDDQGAIDMWGDPTFRGDVFRGNYFHHVGSQWGPSGKEPGLGQAAIRLDDAISGVTITGNLFFRCGGGGHGFGGVQIHGGKDNVVCGNAFVECRAAVSLSPWADQRWVDFVNPFLGSPQIDRALYETRYPQLKNLVENANSNEVRGNLVLRCGALLSRGPGRTVAEGNRVVAEQAGFESGPGTSLALPADEGAWKAAGLERIPVEGIGLRCPPDNLPALRADPPR